MRRWIIPAVGGAVLAGAAVVLAFTWSRSGDSAAAVCDHDSLVAAMHEAIGRADRDAMDSTSLTMPSGCSPDDMTQTMMEVSRSWHVMPDGTMMRASLHASP